MNDYQSMYIGDGEYSGEGWGRVQLEYIPGDEYVEKTISGNVSVHYLGDSTYTITGRDEDIKPIISAVFDRMQQNRDFPQDARGVEVSDEIIAAAEARVSDIEIQLEQANALLKKAIADRDRRDAEKWQEGYSQGVADEITSQEHGGEYSPNRVNPYSGGGLDSFVLSA